MSLHKLAHAIAGLKSLFFSQLRFVAERSFTRTLVVEGRSVGRWVDPSEERKKPFLVRSFVRPSVLEVTTGLVCVPFRMRTHDRRKQFQCELSGGGLDSVGRPIVVTVSCTHSLVRSFTRVCV